MKLAHFLKTLLYMDFLNVQGAEVRDLHPTINFGDFFIWKFLNVETLCVINVETLHVTSPSQDMGI
jgi:hypothetical protein